jgi:hypothetical protein
MEAGQSPNWDCSAKRKNAPTCHIQCTIYIEGRISVKLIRLNIAGKGVLEKAVNFK